MCGTTCSLWKPIFLNRVGIVLPDLELLHVFYFPCLKWKLLKWKGLNLILNVLTGFLCSFEHKIKWKITIYIDGGGKYLTRERQKSWWQKLFLYSLWVSISSLDSWIKDRTFNVPLNIFLFNNSKNWMLADCVACSLWSLPYKIPFTLFLIF